MKNPTNIEIISAYGRTEDVRELFSEYTEMLIAGDPTFKKYLEIQAYDDELCHLEAKYGLPDGRLYLAYCDKKSAGCIALRKTDDENCEMKRLFVRPQFRGRQIGTLLVDRIIADAKEIGYKYMLLDTLPFLTGALYLYKKTGFHEIPRYNDSPMDNSIYMKLDLI